MNEKQVNMMSEKQVQNLHRQVAELEVELKKCQEEEVRTPEGDIRLIVQLSEQNEKLKVELKKCQEGEQIVGIANLETGIGIDFVKQNEALKAQNEKLVAELNEATAELINCIEQHNLRKRAKDELETKNADLDQAKRLLEASVAQLKQDKIAMQQELEVALAQNAEVKMKYNHLRTELEKLITQ